VNKGLKIISEEEVLAFDGGTKEIPGNPQSQDII
jgi:hypothetical protein